MVRIACIGDSITEGSPGSSATYPSVLRALLNSVQPVEVHNLGMGSTTMSRTCKDMRWMDGKTWKENHPKGDVSQLLLSQSKPAPWDFVIIMLGTNDAYEKTASCEWQINTNACWWIPFSAGLSMAVLVIVLICVILCVGFKRASVHPVDSHSPDVAVEKSSCNASVENISCNAFVSRVRVLLVFLAVVVVITIITSMVIAMWDSGDDWNDLVAGCRGSNSTQCTFAQDYISFITYLNTELGTPAANVYLLIPPPTIAPIGSDFCDRAKGINADLPELIPKIAAAADVPDLNVVSVFNALGGQELPETQLCPSVGCTNITQPIPACQYMYPTSRGDPNFDGVHPSSKGHQKIAEAVYQRLISRITSN